MYPELINISMGNEENFILSSYRFFGLLAAGYMSAAAFSCLKKNNVNAITTIILIVMTSVFFLIGSRFLYMMLYLPEAIANPESVFVLSLRNFSLHGGLLFAIIFCFVVFKKIGKNPFWLMDRIAPHAGIAVAIMRVGCFLNGCCYGKQTLMPWGITPPLFSQAHLAQLYGGVSLFSILPNTVHPTQLYEMIAALIASTVAWIVLKKNGKDGLTTAVFCLLFSSGRLVVFFFREFPVASDLSNLIRGPVVYGVVMTVALLWILAPKIFYVIHNLPKEG